MSAGSYRGQRAGPARAGAWIPTSWARWLAGRGCKVICATGEPQSPPRWRHSTPQTERSVILFHGAFPDRYELRPLVPIARDVVTGELILPQIIAAAKSNPEGGFVEYYFDDPDDDTDRADIPKTGYARVFSGEVRRPGGCGSLRGDLRVGLLREGTVKARRSSPLRAIHENFQRWD